MKRNDSYKIPERFKWAMTVIQPKPSDKILEIGCGSGTLTALIAEKLTNGRITAIDRSPSMIRTAKNRNKQFIETGKASVIETSLEDWACFESFDKVVAFNVSMFWMYPERSLPFVKQLLKPTGRFFVLYQPPGNTTADDIHNMTLVFETRGVLIENVLIKKMLPTPSGCIITTL